MAFQTGLEFALQLDHEDELAGFRSQFVMGDPDTIYLDGCSLGRLPRCTVTRMREVIESEWALLVIRGWRGAGWHNAPNRIGDKLGQLLGAAADQIIVSDGTSVNLFKLIMAALELKPERRRIVTDEFNFSTDLYILQSCVRLLQQDHRVEVLRSDDGVRMDAQRFKDALDTDTALVTASSPSFKSSFLYDIPALTRAAHEQGALVLWDLSHAVGVVPIELDRWGVDFAVGCSYKYLNGGPGAPAWLYVRRDLQQSVLSPISGWWSHRSPSDFSLQYEPAEGISRFLSGSIPVLSTIPVEEGVDLILKAGLERIRAKSTRLTSYLIWLVDEVLSPFGYSVGSPRDPLERGGHVSVRHLEANRINSALGAEMNVIAEYRPPDGLRLGLPPLYVSFADVWETVQRLRRVVEEKRYLQYEKA